MPSYGTLKDIRYKKGLLTSDREKFDNFREKWSNVLSPAMYFETKFERPVGFDEFSSAVVPTTASNEVKQALWNAGVQIYEYDKEKEGDLSRAFNEAINSSDNILADFYSNKKVSSTARKTRSSEAQARLDETLSAAKVEEKSKTANKSGEKLREQRVYHGSGAHPHLSELRQVEQRDVIMAEAQSIRMRCKKQKCSTMIREMV